MRVNPAANDSLARAALLLVLTSGGVRIHPLSVLCLAQELGGRPTHRVDGVIDA